MLLLVNQLQRGHDIAHSFIEMCKNVTSNEFMYDIDGNQYLDFFCGAGSLNYGHNNAYIREKVILLRYDKK